MANLCLMTEQPVHPRLQCVLCDKDYEYNVDVNDFLKHLAVDHKLIIADVKLISNFQQYIDIWRRHIKGGLGLSDICYVVKTNCGESDQGTQENYYLLCDKLPLDKEIRISLQQNKLAEVLQQQEQERTATDFRQTCLFCSESFLQRSLLFDHMIVEHAFNIGNPNNLVYVNEYLDQLRSTLENCRCLYCDRTFRDRVILKEHMRKKKHRRLRVSDKKYDKFYLINYLEFGKTWTDVINEDEGKDDAQFSDNDDDWDAWKSDVSDDVSGAACLFCGEVRSSVELLQEHMKAAHGFDLDSICKENHLTFYKKIKLINYIRRQVELRTCIQCEEKFDGPSTLLGHMTDEGHMTSLPAESLWNQPQYFFPTCDNDNLLCCLETDDAEEADQLTTVVPEDFPVKESILRHSTADQLRDLAEIKRN